MNQDIEKMADIEHPFHGTVRTYTAGFILSLIFTLGAYYIVVHKLLTGPWLIGSISTLALVQAAAQILFFLHIGSEKRPRWNLMIFSFMLMVLVIIVVGSLWIMSNLNYNVMPAMENPVFMHDPEVVHK